MKTLYKLDSTGKVRIVKFWTEGSNIIQEAGLLDGKLVKTETPCVAKNLGKINETTPEEQALSEMESRITEKLKEEYFETIEEAQSSKVILPMLAKKYEDEKHKVKFPCWVQPKLDGMRCHGYSTKMISRKNTPIDTMSHIQNEISVIGPLILDGELYAHGLNFQENMRLIKKERPESVQVTYHVYDMVDENLPFIQRYNRLRDIVYGMKNVELVPTYEIKNEDELKYYHSQFLNEGYEGTIIRHGNGGYDVNKRSSSLLKYKDFQDIACPVIDVLPHDRRPNHGKCVCQLPDGKTFETGMKFSHAEREEILTNKENYIGQIAEIRFFEYSEDGIPRFPVCVGFRLDK